MIRHVFACGMSRSGTTLLATILDSHPAISMGYELLPAGLPPLAESISLLREAVAAGGSCPEWLERRGVLSKRKLHRGHPST